MVCKDNKYVKNVFDIIFQVTIIAIFLTVFFFTYVSGVEKEEFESQLNLIVNNVLTEDDIKALIPQNLSSNQKEQLAIVISGAIESAKTKTALSQTKSIKAVIDNNNNVKSATYKKIYYVLIVIVILCLITLAMGYCLPIFTQFKEAVIIVFFVALTELVFLQVIAKNYISADPNKVKSAIADGIKKWVADPANGLS
jgi:hypothetical protein